MNLVVAGTHEENKTAETASLGLKRPTRTACDGVAGVMTSQKKATAKVIHRILGILADPYP